MRTAVWIAAILTAAAFAIGVGVALIDRAAERDVAEQRALMGAP